VWRYTQRAVAQAAAQLTPASIVVAEHEHAPQLVSVAAVAPDARFTITVQAKRLKV
jgi:hypothetical protein